MKTFNALTTLVAFLFFTLVACSDAPRKEPADSNQPGSNTATPTSNVQEDSLITEDDFENMDIKAGKAFTLNKLSAPDLKVKIHSTGKYSAENAKFAEAVGQHLEMVVNSQQFKDLVESQQFTENEGLSATQIYERIVKAKELKELPGNQEGVIDLRLTTTDVGGCFSPFKRTLGLDNGSGTTYTCTNFLNESRNDSAVGLMAGHYLHEFLHGIGFSHLGTKSTSVPYRVGSIVRMITLNGIVIEGIVRQNLKFETSDLGKKTQYDVFISHMFARGGERLEELAKLVGKRIRLHISTFDAQAVYGAEIMK